MKIIKKNVLLLKPMKKTGQLNGKSKEGVFRRVLSSKQPFKVATMSFHGLQVSTSINCLFLGEIVYNLLGDKFVIESHIFSSHFVPIMNDYTEFIFVLVKINNSKNSFFLYSAHILSTWCFTMLKRTNLEHEITC